MLEKEEKENDISDARDGTSPKQLPISGIFKCEESRSSADNPMHDLDQSSAEVDGLQAKKEVSPNIISPAEEEASAEGRGMPEERCLGEDEMGVASGFVEGVVKC